MANKKISEETLLDSPTGDESVRVASGGSNFQVLLSAIAALATKVTVGLGNVDNTSDSSKWSAVATLTNKVINAASNTISNLTTAMFAANVIDTDGAFTANSDTRLASQKATKSYVGTAIAAYVAAQDIEVLKGAIDCSTSPNYPAADAGHVYRVSVAGKIGGASGVNVEVNDRLECFVDGSVSGNHAAVGANWIISQVNIDGAVTGPVSATSGNIATFNGVSGKVIQDGGKAVSTDGTFASNSDSKLPTEKATKTYVDAAIIASTTGVASIAGNTGAFTLSNGLTNVGNDVRLSAKPAFLVTKGGTDQTGIADSTFTPITFSTEIFDTGGYFASNAWTPPAGLVTMSSSILASGTFTTGGQIALLLKKNGVAYKQWNTCASAAFGGSVTFSIVERANGTDAYTVEAYMDVSSGTATISGNNLHSFFSGAWLSP